MIHEAILGRTPSPASTVNPRIPRELDRIIGKALEKDRDLRYQHAADMRADLKRVKRDTESGRLGGCLRARDGRAFAGSPVARRLRCGDPPGGCHFLSGLEARWTVSNFVSLPLRPRTDRSRFVGDAAFPALSPDGKFVAYVTGKEEQRAKADVTGSKGRTGH